MDIRDPGTTNPNLLTRLADWGDHRVWHDFVGRYDPFIRSICRRFRFDVMMTEDLCQQIWIELARRMRTYCYDPGKTFRGWLLKLCRSRAIDLARKQKSNPEVLIEDWLIQPDWQAALADESDTANSDRSLLLIQAEVIQKTIQQRVEPGTWHAFWMVVVEEHSVREAAETSGLTYAAAFAAQKRVRRMLRDEANRLLED